MSITHIPFYPSDWLGGTRILSDAETGVYITLICLMYEMAGPIKRDDERLSRYCGCKSKVGFVKILNYLIDEGKITESKDGLFNDKTSKVIQNVIEKSSTARASAQRRWDKKPKENNTIDHANASQTHMPIECYPKPKPLSDSKLSLVNVQKDAFLFFNDLAGVVGWPQIKELSQTRKASLNARIKDAGGLDEWKSIITTASKAPHLIGQNDRGWRAGFDWLLNPTNFTKVSDGNYSVKQTQSKWGKI